MKVEVVICDRCDRRIDGEGNLAVVRVERGDRRTVRDLCAVCVSDLDLFLRGVPVGQADPIPALADVDAALLAEARRVANAGVEAYAAGATADELVGRLRDVATAARRR